MAEFFVCRILPTLFERFVLDITVVESRNLTFFFIQICIAIMKQLHTRCDLPIPANKHSIAVDKRTQILFRVSITGTISAHLTDRYFSE